MFTFLFLIIKNAAMNIFVNRYLSIYMNIMNVMCNTKLLSSEVILIYNLSSRVFNFTHSFRCVNKYLTCICEIFVTLRKSENKMWKTQTGSFAYVGTCFFLFLLKKGKAWVFTICQYWPLLLIHNFIKFIKEI